MTANSKDAAALRAAAARSRKAAHGLAGDCPDLYRTAANSLDRLASKVGRSE